MPAKKKAKNHWFHPKKYGYGVTPATWEGWFATIGFVVLALLSAFANNFFTPDFLTFQDIARWIFDILLLSFVFMLVFEKKTSDEIKWRWGHPFSK